MNPIMHDIGAYILGMNAFNPVILNANSTAENGVESNGVTLDRELVSPGQPVQLSGQLVLPFSYSLSAAATVTVTANLQHSSSSTAWTDLADKDGSTSNSKVAGTTASTAAQTGNTQLRANFDLGAAKRYVRCQLTATFSGTTTADDADMAGVFVFGGYQINPASTSGD